VRVIFPSEQAFLHAAVARVDIYDGGGLGDKSPDAICRALSRNPPTPPAGVQPLATTGNRGACELRDGGATLTGVGVGRRVIFVEAQGFDSQAILRGCTVQDIFGEPEELSGADAATAADVSAIALVEVPLAILPDFPAGPAGCADIVEKCEEAVECRP